MKGISKKVWMIFKQYKGFNTQSPTVMFLSGKTCFRQYCPQLSSSCNCISRRFVLFLNAESKKKKMFLKILFLWFYNHFFIVCRNCSRESLMILNEGIDYYYYYYWFCNYIIVYPKLLYFILYTDFKKVYNLQK